MCESVMDAWFAMKQTDPRARAVWGGRWVVSLKHHDLRHGYGEADAWWS